MASVYLTYTAGSGGGGSSSAVAAKVVNLASGSISQSFSYTGSVSGGLAPILGAIINTVDSTPIFLQAIVTAFSTSGFTVTFNVAPDSANYKLAYVVVKNI